jgi:hypothetical protein
MVGDVCDQLIKAVHFLVQYLHLLFSSHLIEEMRVAENGILCKLMDKTSIAIQFLLTSLNKGGKLLLIEIYGRSLLFEVDVNCGWKPLLVESTMHLLYIIYL